MSEPGCGARVIYDAWISYFVQTENELWRIAVDAHLRDRAPIANLPIMTRITIPLLGESAFGCFFAPDDAVVLDRAVDGIERLAAQPATGLRRLLGAEPNEVRFVGRRTRGGKAELYFHSSRPIGKRVLIELEGHLPGREWTAEHREDRAWEFYLNTLHPGAALNPLLLTAVQVEQRRQAGDELAKPRPVDHTLLFRDGEGRCRFLADLLAGGVDCGIREFEVGEGERRFGVDCTVEHAVERHVVDTFVVALSHRAERFGGAYDGWGAFSCEAAGPR